MRRIWQALITFLFFPVSYSTWSITAENHAARIIVLSSMAACFGALLLAVVQYYWLGMRAEGGAGNAIVFATVACLSVMMCLAGALSGIEKNRAPAGLRGAGRSGRHRLFRDRGSSGWRC